MKTNTEPSPHEVSIQREIKAVYNTGDLERAVDMSIEFLREFPDSYLARYEYAVNCGDLASSTELTESEKDRYKEIGLIGIKALFDDPDFQSWPVDFRLRVRNEYYWFYEMPKEQFELGLEKIALGKPGDYSATVGASMLAFNALKEGNGVAAEEWATKSLFHFRKFEEYAPEWYNINFFSSKALACLGRYEEAVSCFLDMYRKRKCDPVVAEVLLFEAEVSSIRSLRTACGRD